MKRARINGVDYRADLFTLEVDGESVVPVNDITPQNPLLFPLRRSVVVRAHTASLPPGHHTIDITLHTQPFGILNIVFDDQLTESIPQSPTGIPRNSGNDYTPETVTKRQRFLQQFTQTTPNHLTQYSFEPTAIAGNCENFVGIAQVPIGLAGPIRINGEHVQGEFLIPLAATEPAMRINSLKSLQV